MAKNDILIEEDLEIAATTGAAPVHLPPKIISLFPAFAHRNFQLYVFGQSISLIGFWLHQVAVGWLVFELTNSAFWVGTVAAINSLPFLMFTIFAGVFIDRVNKQKLLVVTQLAEATMALLLGLLILSGNINLTIVIILAFLHGIVGSIDLPTRLTFIVEMVGKRDMASAMPINNGLFNAARFIGPAVAGIIISTFSIAWPFILNGLSFIAGIWAILAIKPVYSYDAEVDVHPFKSLKSGVKFAFGHSKIFYFIILAFLSSLLIWPFQTLMPLVAERVYASGANGYGSLLSAAGLGGFAGAIFTSAMSRRKNKIHLVSSGLFITSVGLLLFSINRDFLIAHLLLVFSGFGLLLMISTLNTLVQHYSPDQMRARIMAVYLTMFIGMFPVGNQIAGIVAEKTSAITTIGIGAGLMLAAGLIFFLKGIFKNLSS